MRSLRFPRTVETDPRAEDLRQSLVASAQPIRRGSDIEVATARLDSAMEAALKSALRARRVVRGLENVKRKLASEARGQSLADRKRGEQRGERVSRLLLLAGDGSAGLDRQVETILQRHGGRVLAIRLDVDGAALGTLLFGPNSSARLLMVEHKDAVAELLLRLADQLEGGSA